LLVGGDVAGVAAPNATQLAQKSAEVDVELVLAVDVSYSMDLDELAVQREGYAQAMISSDFLQALKSGPHGKVAITYFEWAAADDQKVIIPWRVVEGPESADASVNGAFEGFGTTREFYREVFSRNSIDDPARRTSSCSRASVSSVRASGGIPRTSTTRIGRVGGSGTPMTTAARGGSHR